MTQLRAAVGATALNDATADHPRARLWGAWNAMLRDDFVAGMRLLYDANAIVSFLFNTIVPHVEERLRFDTLAEEMAGVKPASAEQNEARLTAILKKVTEADATSRARRVDDDFARMRDGVSALYMDVVVVRGLTTLYVSSKKARGVLELIFQRLDDALRNDDRIKATTDIPMEAMLSDKGRRPLINPLSGWHDKRNLHSLHTDAMYKRLTPRRRVDKGRSPLWRGR